jgi:hypothetical protein
MTGDQWLCSGGYWLLGELAHPEGTVVTAS